VKDLGFLRLTGRRVHLEPLAIRHLDELLDAANEDRSTYRYTRVPADQAAMSLHVNDLIRERADGVAYPFVVIAAEENQVVGMTRFLDLQFWADSLVPSVAEIGGTWLRRSAQGRDINTEAKYVMLSEAFDTWSAHRVSFQTDERNARSRAAIEALGARFEGVQRAHKPAADGGIRNTAWYSIIADEWPESRDRLLTILSSRRDSPFPR
jgi:RimJ/RimL family protein N-acetyltransferase